MRPLPNSDEFHPTEWSPVLPPLAPRRAAETEVSLPVQEDGPQVGLVRRPLAGHGDRRLLAIEALLG